MKKDRSYYIGIGKEITEKRHREDITNLFPKRTVSYLESGHCTEFTSFHYIAVTDQFFRNTEDMDQLNALFYVVERKIPLTFVDAIRGFQIYGVINADGDTEYSLGIIMKEDSVLGVGESDKFTGEYEFTRIDDHTLMLEVIIKTYLLYKNTPSRKYHLYIYIDINSANEHCLGCVRIKTKTGVANKSCNNYVYYED